MAKAQWPHLNNEIEHLDDGRVGHVVPTAVLGEDLPTKLTRNQHWRPRREDRAVEREERGRDREATAGDPSYVYKSDMHGHSITKSSLAKSQAATAGWRIGYSHLHHGLEKMVLDDVPIVEVVFQANTRSQKSDRTKNEVFLFLVEEEQDLRDDVVPEYVVLDAIAVLRDTEAQQLADEDSTVLVACCVELWNNLCCGREVGEAVR